jgi:hypothetical protein
MCIIIKEHCDSLESVERRGQIVKVVGKGIMKSPGHPAGNQQYTSQKKILNILTTSPFLIPIYKEYLNNTMEYLGEYTLHEFKIKESFEGFRYFEYTMIRSYRVK